MIVFTFLQKTGALILQLFPSWYISTKKGGEEGSCNTPLEDKHFFFGGGGGIATYISVVKVFSSESISHPIPLPHKPNYDVINGYLVTSLDVMEEGEKMPGYLIGMSE